LIYFSNCKINIGLNILGERADGYHDLATIFYPLPFYDIIEILPSTNFKFTNLGQTIPGDTNQNLCIKAYELLLSKGYTIPPIEILLYKNIPTGAGLGGGSANASTILLALNNKFNLGITTENLIKYALELGSDCPFFILNKACYATGRGETLTPLDLNLKGYFIVLVNPGLHVPTGWAFTEVKKHNPYPLFPKDITTVNINDWKNIIYNDFEQAIFGTYPEVAAIKNELYSHSAIYSSMSGSGSSVYGIFKNMPTEITFPKNYLVKTIAL
jgi:4-diphosphocytidyl-2-C-methyl-D-erythritol kinase